VQAFEESNQLFRQLVASGLEDLGVSGKLEEGEHVEDVELVDEEDDEARGGPIVHGVGSDGLH
jgi:hypothetical protein